ncbi:response regulator [Microcoleus sp. F10-C6]|uniref:response regulator n=1 Tax=unclassified Microcoleus TaxID=2642155 RepID=UPI002FD45B4F
MANEKTWRLLFVDDEEDFCEQARDFFDNEEAITDGEASVQVTTLTSFEEALNILENGRFDLIILDVRLQSNEPQAEEEAGISTLEAIKRKRFIPIIFYTGVPHLVSSFETPLIKVVEKTEGFKGLQKVMKEIFTTQLPAVNRALIRHLETVQRDYMWDFVAKHWEELSDTHDHAGLAYLLARRLGVSLSGSGIYQLTKDLGGSINTVIREGCVHPMHYYVMPPLHLAHPLAGDIYKENIEEQVKYWIILTPSCDFAQKKVEEVLFARCELLSEQAEYKAWQSNLPNPSKSNEEKLKALLKNNRQKSQQERFYFLPGTLALPDLLVDFQQLKTLQCKELEKPIQEIWERVASLDSPFTEALLARFTRYLGRLGTPDLDIDVVMNKFRNKAN